MHYLGGMRILPGWTNFSLGARPVLLTSALALGASTDADATFGNACAHGVCDDVQTLSDTATAVPHVFTSFPAQSFSTAHASVAGIGVRAYVLAAYGGAALLVDHANASYSAPMQLGAQVGLTGANLHFTLVLSGGFSGGDTGVPCGSCGGQSPWTSEGKVTADLSIYRGFDLVSEKTIQREWHSNHGYLDQNPTAVANEVFMLSGDSIGIVRTLTVRSSAGNRPCLSGAGTCGIEGTATVDGNFSATLVLEDFRLFDAESGEEIVDFTLTDASGIDYVAIDRGCGNGVVDTGETCDDANYRAGDCCAPNCQIEAAECEAGDCGDADDNGALQSVDALATLRAAVGLAECALCHCDANDSHDLSAGDALTILRSATGNAVPLRCVPCPA